MCGYVCCYDERYMYINEHADGREVALPAISQVVSTTFSFEAAAVGIRLHLMRKTTDARP